MDQTIDKVAQSQPKKEKDHLRKSFVQNSAAPSHHIYSFFIGIVNICS